MVALATPKTRTYLKLTTRWRALKPHPEQSRLWYSPARFKTIRAGRRSGKTELAKRRLAWSLWEAFVRPRPWDDPRYFAAGPTRDQTKRIFWKDLKRLVPPAWVRRIYESDLMILTKWDAELWCVGLDKPDRIEGSSWDGGVVTEYASCKAGIFDANIRPALADRAGWLWLEGVPDFVGPSQPEYEKFSRWGRERVDPDWDDFHWRMRDIQSAEEIASMRRGMDPKLFDQEEGGLFVIPGNRAFPDFDDKPGGRHVRADLAEYDPSLPLCYSLDFNINPMCSGVIQHHKGVIRVIDEFQLPDTKTTAAVEAFIGRARERGWKLDNLEIYGDPSGAARDSTSGESDWIQIKNLLKRYNIPFSMKVPSSHSPIADTRNAVNAKLLNAEGTTALYINPRCTGLIEGLKNTPWPSDMAEFHHVAWLRYFTQYRYPVLRERPKTETTTRYGVQT